MAEERDDVEAAWARIMADYDREVDDPVNRWPVDEDVADAAVEVPDDAPPSARSRTDQPARRLGPDPVEEGLRPSDNSPDDDLLDSGPGLDPGQEIARDAEPDAGGDSEHHFVPPVPPPLPRPDLPTGLAWAGVLGGPVLLLLATMLAWEMPRLLTAACIVGFVGGMVYLVATMDNGSGRDGWDNGAQV